MACTTALLLVVTTLHCTPAEHVAPGSSRSVVATGGKPDSAKVFLGAVTLRDELRQAVSEALGAAHDLNQWRISAVREGLRPMWSALAKTGQGRVDRRSLRYVVHRYLMKTRSISVIGLEPRQHSGTDSDAAILADLAPAFVRDALKGEIGGRAADFSLEDAAAMISMLEELVQHQGRDIIGTLYEDTIEGGPLDWEAFAQMLETFMIRWLVAQDIETSRTLEANRTLLHESFEEWPIVRDYVTGLARTLQATSWKRPVSRALNLGAWNPFADKFSVKEAHAVADEVTLSFGGFWRSECERIKTSLVRLDHASTGRVLLSEFHGARLAGEWRFSESSDYLRNLGALDETVSASNPRVIITNYLQGASNCMVAHEHFRVCCPDDCLTHLSEIEEAVGAPTVSVERLLQVVANLISGLDDAAPRLTHTLRSQLHEIAGVHRGQVPLHGRLFALWLHYVFPHDCPFPHKAGTVSSMAPSEFGGDVFASERELERNAELGSANASATLGAVARDAPPLASGSMAQWSLEEELLTDKIHLHAPWEGPSLLKLPLLGALGATSVLAALVSTRRTTAGKPSASVIEAAWGRASYV